MEWVRMGEVDSRPPANRVAREYPVVAHRLARPVPDPVEVPVLRPQARGGGFVDAPFFQRDVSARADASQSVSQGFPVARNDEHVEVPYPEPRPDFVRGWE